LLSGDVGARRSPQRPTCCRRNLAATADTLELAVKKLVLSLDRGIGVRRRRRRRVARARCRRTCADTLVPVVQRWSWRLGDTPAV